MIKISIEFEHKIYLSRTKNITFAVNQRIDNNGKKIR